MVPPDAERPEVTVHKLLIVSGDGPQYREIFAREAPDLDVHLYDKADPEAAARFAREMDILFAWYFPPELLADAPNLTWVSSTGAGVDNIMAARPYLPEGVVATRMVDIFNDAMAEYVLGYLFAVTLDVRRVLRQQAAREWTQFAAPLLRGKTAVVIGLGRIGGEVARTLRRAGLDVIGVSRSGRPAEGVEDVRPIARLDEVLPRADFLVIVTPLTSETRGLIDARRLALLPRHAVLVNVARGAIVDQDALIRALGDGTIRGAVLDVFVQEPLPADSPLWGMENAIVTPHISGPDDIPVNARRFLENYRRFVAGEPLDGVVDFARGY
jgi:phosphoglycerate dehydrogenase-like enzyme